MEVIDHVTNTASVGAVTSPWWLPHLADVSVRAAALLPILGCLWILVQIVTRLYAVSKKK